MNLIAAVDCGNQRRMSYKTKLIGYGSRIRGDDAAGLILAEGIADWEIPGLQVVATPQLYPELAHQISTFDQVIFVDATAASDSAQNVRVQELIEKHCPAIFGHAYSPGQIVEMARRLYGATPKIWIVTLPGFEFDWKEGLSTATRAALPGAMEIILRLVQKGH